MYILDDCHIENHTTSPISLYSLPGARLAMACKRSKFMTGSASWTGSQSNGGDAGGEMRNCLVKGGNFKWGLCSPLVLIG